MKTCPPSPGVVRAAQAVPERYYTHHAGRGETIQRSNPVVIQRELTSLQVERGINVLEIGTGSGYSSALLAHLTGPTGQVTSIDIDPYLARWANVAHHDRGIGTVRCYGADGTRGFPARGPYDRLVAWCTPPLLPRSWVEQLTDGGLLVAPLPLAPVPKLTVVATIRAQAGQPEVTGILDGGYVETSTGTVTDADSPLRWVDWENRLPGPSWISLAWREDDDWRHTAARTTLARLLKDAHTEPYLAGTPGLDWGSWRTWVAATGDPHLTMAGLSPSLWALGHATPATAAVLTDDGTILADAPDSSSLALVRGWLADWENAARPAPGTYTPHLVPYDDGQGMDGWNLRLTR